VNKLYSMADVAKLLNMSGNDLARRTKQRLQRISKARGEIQLFTIGTNRLYTTEADLRVILPELFAHETAEEEALRPHVETMHKEVDTLKKKFNALEVRLFNLTRKQ